MNGVRELMRMHVEALFTHDGNGRLVAVNDGGNAPAPRFFLGRTAEGCVWRFRYDVPDDIVGALDALCLEADADAQSLGPPTDVAAFEALLARSSPVARTWIGPVFHWPTRPHGDTDAVAITPANRMLLEPHLTAWMDDVATCQPFFASVSDGRAVSVCASVRTTPAADEAGVETHPSHRRQGHAAQAVSAWAQAVFDAGRIPLYSTSWSNTASQGVARTLRLVQFGADFHIT